MHTANAVAEYLELMDREREACFASLEGISHEQIWWRPADGEWSIGETLDHLRVFTASMVWIFRITWSVELPWAKLRLHRPYEVEIENHYARPDFPMNVGWIWAPKHRPDKPLPLPALKGRLSDIHQQARMFYAGREPDLLGHVSLYDPVMGWMNLVQALRLGIYHDELHYEVIARSLSEL